MFALVLGAGFVVCAVLVWRYCRRKWRAFHSHGRWSGRRRCGRPPHRVGSPGRRPTRIRVGGRPDGSASELWRAVDRADAAVRAASQAGAPTASLPALCDRLHQVSIGLDRVLRVEQAGPVPGQVASQAIDVMRAATDVQRAAVASASDANGQRVSTLVRDAQHEIQCLDAGLASAAAVLPPDR